METSFSFPPVSSALSFEMANRICIQFSNGRDQAPACAAGTWDMQRVIRCRSIDNNNHYHPRLHPYERQSEKTSSAVASGTGFDLKKTSTVDAKIRKVQRYSPIEEYSLGPGNPWKYTQNK
jgi:hypothetical protein